MTSSWKAVRELIEARSDEPEILDGEDLDPAEVRDNLRELATLNRLPGGTRTSIAAIEHLARGRDDVSVLDIGTGGGDMPVGFVRHGRGRGARWTVVATDKHPEIVAFAGRRTRRESGITLQVADGRRLPFPDRSFDVAHSSLLLHHLDPADAVEVLAEMARVARDGIVVNDLHRGPLQFAVTAVTVLALTRNRYTRHDGLVSARRAYTLAERHELLRNAGLHVAWESSRLSPRVVTAAAGRAPRSGTS